MKRAAEHRVACTTENRRLRWQATAIAAVLGGVFGGWSLIGFGVAPATAIGITAAVGAIAGWLFGPRAWAFVWAVVRAFVA